MGLSNKIGKYTDASNGDIIMMHCSATLFDTVYCRILEDR